MNIVKFEAEQKIYIELLKQRGDVIATARATSYPIEFVQRVAQKMKKRQQRDVSYWVATNVTQHFLQGHEQRIQWIQRLYNQLEGEEKAIVSSCCKAPVDLIVKTIQPKKVKKGKKPKPLKTVPVMVCSKCEKVTKTRILNRLQIYDLLLQVIDSSRKEDLTLVDGADKLGFSGKVPVPVTEIKQNNLVLMGNNINPTIVKQVEDMSPQERQRLRKDLASRIITDVQVK